MDYRGVLLLCALSSAAVLGLTNACSGPDPGQITFIERPRGSNGELTSGGSNGIVTEAGVTTEGGTTEAGTDGGGSSGDPVFGMTTFAAGTPGRGAPAKAANAMHAGDASGKECIGCHTGDWSFAGTLYSDAAGTARVAGAEIRITGPDGVEYAKTYSDVDGNFWTDTKVGTAIPVNSRVAVRSADKKKTMSTSVATGQAGCNQGGTCHGTGGTAGKVYLN